MTLVLYSRRPLCLQTVGQWRTLGLYCWVRRSRWNSCWCCCYLFTPDFDRILQIDDKWIENSHAMVIFAWTEGSSVGDWNGGGGKESQTFAGTCHQHIILAYFAFSLTWSRCWSLWRVTPKAWTQTGFLQLATGFGALLHFQARSLKKCIQAV